MNTWCSKEWENVEYALGIKEQFAQNKIRLFLIYIQVAT